MDFLEMDGEDWIEILMISLILAGVFYTPKEAREPENPPDVEVEKMAYDAPAHNVNLKYYMKKE